MAAALLVAVHRVLFRPVQGLTPGGRASPETAEIVADETRREKTRRVDACLRCAGNLASRTGRCGRAVAPVSERSGMRRAGDRLWSVGLRVCPNGRRLRTGARRWREPPSRLAGGASRRGLPGDGARCAWLCV